MKALSPRSSARILAGLLAITVTGISMVGCYGRFPLTNMLYEWNGKVTNNGFVNSIIMIVLNIIPVYGVCILVDAIIVNSIEYWSGDRMISGTYEQPDGTTVVMAEGETDDHAVMTIWRGEEKLAERHYLRQPDGLVKITDESGVVMGSVRPDSNGGLSFYDEKGAPVQNLSAAMIADYKSRAAM